MTLTTTWRRPYLERRAALTGCGGCSVSDQWPASYNTGPNRTYIETLAKVRYADEAPFRCGCTDDRFGAWRRLA
ncbi:MAG: hypothetical protein ABJG55_11690 [Paracoccaceae bacterium]